jgi:hypothetical protein
VFGGLNRLLVAAAVAGVSIATVLGAPAAALAGCNGNTSAVNVYRECLPSGGGGSSTTPTTSHNSSGKTSPSSGTRPGDAAEAVKHASKKDRRALALVESTRTGVLPTSPSTGAGSEPSAVGSAFDLRSGPGAFLIALAGAALLLVGGSGLRLWHRRRA